MDKGSNLHTVNEEEEEEEEEEWESDPEDGDAGGIRKGEPNKFDILCDGVTNALSLVHASLQDLLELKDELLQHSLPPNVLVNIALTTGKVFRSITDMNVPVNEMVRMMRVYSTPWEEKSAALKKLHEDYEGKKTQLSIAIKRLQMVDAHARRLQREKRIMNWEKLFARLTSARGHGRRWKFMIENFKEKAKLGMDHIQEYLDNLDNQQSDEDDRDLQEVETQMENQPREEETPQDAGSPDEPAEDQNEGGDDDEGEDSDADSDEDSDTKPRPSTGIDESDAESLQLPDNTTEHAGPTYIRPPMKDKECWTHEPEYDCYLHMRVYSPQGLDVKDLKCVLNYEKQRQKTDILDTPPPPVQEEKKEEIKEDKPVRKDSPKMGAGKSVRGLIGRRGRGGAGRGPDRGSVPEPAKEPEPPEEVREPEEQKYETLVFKMPDNILESIQKTEPGTPRNMKVAVHFGPREELVAMATIDINDLDGLELPVIFKPDPKGARWNPWKISGNDSSSEEEEEIDTEEKEYEEEVRKTLRDIDPVSFPLFPIHVGRGESMHMPAGQLPILPYWVKQLRPRKYDRITESESINDIVLDMTGFDLRVTSKDMLHPEMEDAALSARSLSPPPPQEEQQVAPPEDMVPREEVDHILDLHRQELSLLQDEYEQRLQELAASIHAVPEAPDEYYMQDRQRTPLGRSASTRTRSSGQRSLAVHSDAPSLELAPQPPPNQPDRAASHPSRPGRGRKNFLVGRPLPNWGEHLPKNFYDRLRMFEEESLRHRQQLGDKLAQELKETIEKKLASEYKLSKGEQQFDSLKDVSLPAVFMPTRGSNVFNPRAHQYFHPTGSSDLRLTQPPSMVQLPPLHKNKMSVVNLFDLGLNYQRGGSQWLMQRYLQQQQEAEARKQAQADLPEGQMTAPAPTFIKPESAPVSRVPHVSGYAFEHQEQHAGILSAGPASLPPRAVAELD